VIVGKQGWNIEPLAGALRAHVEQGRRLLWLETVGDGDLRHLMQHANGFVQASVAEGFGLPVAEAGAFGVPLLLSDIPVFRELAGDAARYFGVGDATALAELIGSAAAENGKIIHVRPWQEMSAELSRILLGTETTRPKVR
jgi:glycosyltransferase involved in cell wall biosynthesis